MSESSKQQREARRRQREYEARVVVHDIETDRLRSDRRRGITVLAVAAVAALASQLAFALGGFSTQAQVAPPASTPPAPSETLAEPTPTEHVNDAAVPDPALAEDREWTGSITLNDGLDLGITLDGTAAPQAVANFVSLVQSDFYTDVACHRLTTEALYVLQCGDPSGDGTGGPGYEFGPLENIPADAVYPAGTIAMARAADPNSMGSQFFIVYADTQLPAPGYTVFGHVTSGLEELQTQIVDAGVTPRDPAFPGDGTPNAPAVITEITVE